MKLFQITTSYTGESYVRSYAWAEDAEQAKVMFLKMCQGDRWLGRYARASDLSVDELFDASDSPFCTSPSDSGFDR